MNDRELLLELSRRLSKTAVVDPNGKENVTIIEVLSDEAILVSQYYFKDGKSTSSRTRVYKPGY